MSHWTKILNKKNGKGIVTNAKDDDEVKVTKVLEFIPATSQRDAKEGKTIRFMHKWIKNRFRIGSLSVISHWGEQKSLLKTLKNQPNPKCSLVSRH